MATYSYKELLGFQVIKGEVLIKRRLLRAFQEKGYSLTFEQWTVLNVIYSHPGLIQSEIAEKSYKDKTNVTRILDVLSKNGYIDRQKDEMDRRSFRIFLTEYGISCFNELIPIAKTVNKLFVKNIEKEDLDIFLKVLKKICVNSE